MLHNFYSWPESSLLQKRNYFQRLNPLIFFRRVFILLLVYRRVANLKPLDLPQWKGSLCCSQQRLY